MKRIERSSHRLSLDDTDNHKERGQLRGSRLLLVGINYWPEKTGIAPYTTGLAEHLVTRGAAVTVVAGLPYYPEWRISDSYRKTPLHVEERNGVRVIRVRQFVPRRQSLFTRARYEASFMLRSYAAARRQQCDAVVAIVPNLGAGVAARRVARLQRVPFGMLVQDLTGAGAVQSGISGGGLVARRLQRFEQSLARDADAVGVVTSGFFPYFEAGGVAPDRIFHVPNWSHIQAPIGDRAETRARFGWKVDETIVLHAGNMGAKQGLEGVISAARAAQHRGVPVRFVLMGDGNQKAMLVAASGGLSNVTFLSPVSSADFPDVLQAADVLLVHERPTVQNMSLPSKLTSYFQAGRPVVAAVVSGGTTSTEALASGAVAVVEPGHPDLLLNEIMTLSTDEALMERMAAAASDYVRSTLSAAACLSSAEKFIEAVVTAASRGK